MTEANLGKAVRLPAGRRGTITRVQEWQDGMRMYDVEAEDGAITTMVEIAEGSLVPRDDYDQIVALARGIRDGTAKTVEVTDWTADEFRKWILGER